MLKRPDEWVTLQLLPFMLKRLLLNEDALRLLGLL